VAYGLAGAGAWRLAQALAGTWLVHDRGGALAYVVVAARPVAPGARLDSAAADPADSAGPAAALGPIRRIIAPDGSVADPATGWVGHPDDEPAAWGRALLRQIAGAEAQDPDTTPPPPGAPS
jgi:hypothetical protein